MKEQALIIEVHRLTIHFFLVFHTFTAYLLFQVINIHF